MPIAFASWPELLVFAGRTPGAARLDPHRLDTGTQALVVGALAWLAA